MAFNPELIKNEIMPGNTYRIYGAVHGYGEEGYDDGQEYFTVYTWTNFVTEAKRRGMSEKVINQILDNYMFGAGDDYAAFEAEDLDGHTFMTYNKYGEVTSNPESPYRLLTGPNQF
jgi:hypothetical protein